MSSLPRTTPRTTGWLDRLSERQTVLLLLLFGFVLYVPFAGSYGLWDPWETHYGEVARQMTKRNDFISLWWPGSPIDSDGFWSKPVLTFWIMSLAMKLTGLGNGPPGELALSAKTEWVMRVPFCLIALAGLYGVYLIASRFVSRRAGVLSAVVLATMPLYSLVARQAMTDMPFVAPMTLALALAALALFDDEDRELPRKRWRFLSWPHDRSFYGMLALFLLAALPQIVVNVAQLSWRIPKSRIVLPGIVAMLPYIAGVIAFVYYAARAKTKAPLRLYSAAVLAALAVLAKGLAGLGFPVIILVAYLALTWSWRRLARPGMLQAIGIAVVACAVVAVPWHHAMLIRHGKAWWSELYGDNHWKRLMVGRHGDHGVPGTFEYFLRELGWATLPWLPLAPIALVWSATRRARSTADSAADAASNSARDLRQDIFWFGAIWFAVGYAVVSMSMTKFHHYILPSLPGLALALGCFLDELLSGDRAPAARLAALVGLPVLAIVTFDLTSAQKGVQRFIWLFGYDYVNAPQGRPWPEQLNYIAPVIAFAALFAIATFALGWRRLQRIAITALTAGAIVFTWFLLDVYMKQVSEIWSQKRLIATYYQQRRGPDERLIAWQMYWRGENFYTKNEIYEGPMPDRTVFLGDRNAENMKDYFARNPGKRVFFVVEKSRWSTLRGLLPANARDSLRVVDDRNNRFELAVAQL